MPSPKPAYRSSAATLAGYFAGMARADVPPRTVVAAVVPALRLAWDRGAGAALESVELAPARGSGGLVKRRALGADMVETALGALERWAEGERVTDDDRDRYVGNVEAVARSLSRIRRDVRERRARGESIDGRPLLERLHRLAVNDPDAARELRDMAAYYVATGIDALVAEAWVPKPPDLARAESIARSGGFAAEHAAAALYALGEREVGRGPAAEPRYLSRRRSERAEPTGGERPAADAQVLELVRAALLLPVRPEPAPPSPRPVVLPPRGGAARPGDDPEAERYLGAQRGGEFAAALRELFDYDLVGVYLASQTEPGFDRDFAHAFARYPQDRSFGIDALGARPVAEICAVVPMPEGRRLSRVAASRADLDASTDSGLDADVIEAARAFILTRPERFGRPDF